MLLQVWNTGSGAEYNLDGPAGQVYAMAVTTTDKFFAGGQVIIFFVFQLLRFFFLQIFNLLVVLTWLLSV